METTHVNTADLDQEEFLTVPEAARKLRMSVRGLYDLMATGALRSIKISPNQRARRLIRRADLDAFLASRTEDRLGYYS